MPISDLILPTDSSSSQGGLLPSSLTGTSFSSASDNNSSLIGLQKTSTTSSASGLIGSNLETLTNYSNSVSTISDSLPLFNQSVVSTSLASQSLPNNPTTGLDQLTGSGKNLSLVGINSNDSLLNPSPVLKGKFGNFDNHQNFQLTLQDANGNPESFSLTGDGEGEVFQTNLGEQIIFTGTDVTTNVQISASNNLQFGDYIGSSLKVQTKGSIKSGNITLKNTALDNSPGLSLQSGLSDSQSSTDTGYSVTDLTTLLGGSNNYAAAINDSGQIVGGSISSDNSQYHVFLYSDGKMTDLGTLPGASYSYATGINNSGQVVGESYINTTQHTFLYSDGKMTDLGTLPGGSDSYLGAINNSGQIVGTSSTSIYYQVIFDGSLTLSYPEYHAFLYQNGNMSDLGTLPNGIDSNATSIYSNATSINNLGQIVGGSQQQVFHDTSVYVSGGGYGNEPGHIYHSGYYTSSGQAFIYSNGNMTGLGTLPGGDFSTATDINNSGQVIGNSNTGNNSQHAFLYSQGQMTDLGTLPGLQYSRANAINDAGQIIGDSSSDYNFNYNFDHPFLYTNGKMTDLNSLIPQDSGWTLSEATAINNKGQILGYGNISGQYRQFLLNPISTTATPKDGITVGNISTQGSSVLLQGLKINLTGSNVVTKGGNITFDGPTILNSSTGAYTFNSAKSTATSKGGDITFKNTVDSNSAGASSLSLTGGLGNITFNNAVGGNASLKDLTVNSAKTFIAEGDITTKGNIAISANQNITTNSLTSNNGAVKVTSQQGTVATIDITSGGSTTVTASQNLSTGTVLANSGAVSLTSNLGSVTTKDITTSGNADDITLKAASDISTANLSANGSGKVSIFLYGNTNLEDQTNGNVNTGSINANQLTILSSGGVNIQGDTTGKYNVSIVAGYDVTTRKITSSHGQVSLNSSSGSVTVNNIINADRDVYVVADGNITIPEIISSKGAVGLNSSSGSITTVGKITGSNDVYVVASGNVATNDIQTHEGSINITSLKGTVTKGLLANDSGTYRDKTLTNTTTDISTEELPSSLLSFKNDFKKQNQFQFHFLG
ncbi:DUF3466 family protein [Nostoc sp. KVJ3]|uniref:hypothetical protein n=1 Tax=Nostoc sp. KVJ3 TaxID=457945 RepID=UPI0022377C4B|nr:hypothetical protein [Nostoc sp. KVJ3]MCW5319558.1 DUF3466 family protein [Nostoc sp. KVJ3]